MHDGSLGRSYQINDLHLRKVQTYGFLDRVCQQLDLTPTQSEEAKSRYEAVGTWLAEAEDPLLRTSVIYAQGSTAIGTSVKPVGSNEHDVDLISLLPDGTPNMEPAAVKRVVGDRLRANGRYRDIMSEKQRCWRINYANEFHLDITPAIPNPACRNGGELVPDKTLKSWKPSNPKGFRDKFNERAKLVPALLLEKAQRGVTASDSTVEPFPVKSGAKGVLRRTTQVLKRHRDIDFERLDKSLAPLSIIITQLASKSYEYCIRHFAFDNELDLLVHTIKFMPLFIEKREIGGRTHYFILNETTTGENFAEKWNDEPQRAAAFYRWHRKAEADFARLIETEGLDELTAELKDSLGEGLVKRALDAQTGTLSEARTAGRLSVAAGIGLTTAAKATPMPRNTFFGRREE